MPRGPPSAGACFDHRDRCAVVEAQGRRAQTGHPSSHHDDVNLGGQESISLDALRRIRRLPHRKSVLTHVTGLSTRLCPTTTQFANTKQAVRATTSPCSRSASRCRREDESRPQARPTCPSVAPIPDDVESPVLPATARECKHPVVQLGWRRGRPALRLIYGVRSGAVSDVDRRVSDPRRRLVGPPRFQSERITMTSPFFDLKNGADS